jgi:hypothetical protein
MYTADVVAKLKAAKETLTFPPSREDAPAPRGAREVAITTQRCLLDSCPWPGVRDYDRRMRGLTCNVETWREIFGEATMVSEWGSIVSEYDLSAVDKLCRRPLLPFVRAYVRKSCENNTPTELPFDAGRLMEKASAVERTYIERLQQDCRALTDMERRRKR